MPVHKGIRKKIEQGKQALLDQFPNLGIVDQPSGPKPPLTRVFGRRTIPKSRRGRIAATPTPIPAPRPPRATPTPTPTLIDRMEMPLRLRIKRRLLQRKPLRKLPKREFERIEPRAPFPRASTPTPTPRPRRPGRR